MNMDDLLQPFGFQTQIMGQPTVSPTGIPAQVQQATQPEAPDTFAPTKISPHQAWQDRMLMLTGKHPVYQPLAAQQDFTKIMQSYDPNDPVTTIKRVAQIPGMAEQAYKMFEQADTDKERNQSRDTRDAAKRDLITQRLGGLAGVATEQNFPKARQLMIDYVKRWGGNPDDYDIPETYDKDALDLMSGGSITAKDQAAEEARQRALDLHSQALDSLKDYRERRLGQIDTAEGDKNTRFNEGQTNENYRHDHPVARPKSAPYVGKIIDTPHGKMELSPSGLTGKIGDDIWTRGQNGQWNRTGKAPK